MPRHILKPFFESSVIDRLSILELRQAARLSSFAGRYSCFLQPAPGMIFVAPVRNYNASRALSQAPMAVISGGQTECGIAYSCQFTA